MRNALILAAVAALAFTTIVDAKTCTDPKTHKYVKCPTAAAAPMTPASNKAGPGTCKDKHGHFAKCGTVAAIPAAPAAKSAASTGGEIITATGGALSATLLAVAALVKALRRRR